MTRALALALALLAAGCGCPNGDADSLDMPGETPPALTAEVVAVAQAHCDRPIVGTIEWRPAPDASHYGRCEWDGACPMAAWVALPVRDDAPGGWSLAVPGYSCAAGEPLSLTAVCAALAHEIGHWCLDSSDETKVQAWADAVNVEVARAVLQ
jgi:hypothetical protein